MAQEPCYDTFGIPMRISQINSVSMICGCVHTMWSFITFLFCQYVVSNSMLDLVFSKSKINCYANSFRTLVSVRDLSASDSYAILIYLFTAGKLKANVAPLPCVLFLAHILPP
jgi:hypothetical protein